MAHILKPGMKIEIKRLNLISPLCYLPLETQEPFDCREETEIAPDREKLFCFELENDQYRSFEPDKEKLLGRLVSSGEAPDKANGSGKDLLELPRGSYLFAQERRILSREEIIDSAVEIQKEGLWQRLKPGNLLYLRFLFEDGSRVTQLFRPYTET